MSELKLGIYEHYKGKKYLVIGLAGLEADHHKRVMVYVPLYAAPGPRMWTRPLDEFQETVTKEDGAQVPRYKFVGQELPGDLD